MREFTKTYSIYNFAELPEAAKEKVKSEYLENFRYQIYQGLEEIFVDELSEKFPNSDLNVQLDVSNCQGDGVNIYGIFNLQDFTAGWEYWMEKLLPDDIELSKNVRYCYSLKSQQVEEEAENVIWSIRENMDYWQTLTEEGESEIEKYVKNLFQMLENLESDFYDRAERVLSTISDEEMEETASIHGWEYLEDGSLWKE